MKLHFEAIEIEVIQNQFNILLIGFYTEENYLSFQKGMDTEDLYYIERDDQSYSGYGGVESISLSPQQIEVELDEAGKENLECDSVTVDFETDDETYQLLSKKLKFVFGDSLIIN